MPFEKLGKKKLAFFRHFSIIFSPRAGLINQKINGSVCVAPHTTQNRLRLNTAHPRQNRLIAPPATTTTTPTLGSASARWPWSIRPQCHPEWQEGAPDSMYTRVKPGQTRGKPGPSRIQVTAKSQPSHSQFSPKPCTMKPSHIQFRRLWVHRPLS